MVNKRGFGIQDLGFRKVLVLFVLLTPDFWLLTTAFGQQPQAQSGQPMYPVNAKYVQGVGPGYWPTAGAGLLLNLAAGTAFCGNPPTLVPYAGGTLTLTASQTNYVYLDPTASCAPAFNTTGFVPGQIPIAKVVTGGSAITAITDARGWFTPVPVITDANGASVLAPLLDKGGERFNVKAYGAKGDGVTDDTASVNAALTAAATSGGIVYFPQGTYKISNTLTISDGVKVELAPGTINASVLPVFKMGNKTTLEGSGMRGATRIVTNLTNGAVIQSINPAIAYEGIAIRDLNIDNTSASNSGAIGIDFRGVGISEVRNVRIDHVEKAIHIGGDVNGGYYNHFYNVQIINAVIGVHFDTNANKNYWFGGSVQPFGTGGTGFLIDGGASNSLFSPDIENFTGGIGIDIATGGNAVYDPYLELGEIGIKLRSKNNTIWGGGAASSLGGVLIDDSALSAADKLTNLIQLRMTANSMAYGPFLGANEIDLTGSNNSTRVISLKSQGSNGVLFGFEAGSGYSGRAPAMLSKIQLMNADAVHTVWLQAPAAGNTTQTLSTGNGTIPLLENGQTWTAKQTFAKAIIGKVNVVTFSATPTFDASLGNTQKITLTDNVTSSTLSNAVAGEEINFIVCQDSAGSRSFAWPTNVLGGMTIGSTANKCNAQSFLFDGTNAYALSAGVTNM